MQSNGTNEHDMIYNSSRSGLIMPEYGRNIQKLIRFAQKVEPKEKRQAFVERVVRLMMQMNPQNKNIEDNIEKLWKHLFRIAEYDIDVSPPAGIEPSPSDKLRKPDTVEYPRTDAKFKHYGSNIQKLMKKAIAMEDGPKKQGFVTVIGSYMKLAYRTWNKEHYVSDEVIKGDLEGLSEGQLKLSENAVLDTLSQSNKKRKRNSSGNSGGGHHSSNRDHKGRNRGRRRK